MLAHVDCLPKRGLGSRLFALARAACLWQAGLCGARRANAGPDPRAIGGYSLAGLFSLWALSQDAGFAGAASCSGSLWYPGWAEYAAQARYPQGSRVYLSLGEREERARNAALARVGDATRAQYAALLADAGIADTTLVWHPGGHFDQPDTRMIAGLAWLLKKL